MANKNGNISEDVLQKLFSETVDALRDKISSGEANSSDFNAAISMLKNNNITVAPDCDDSIDELEKLIKTNRDKSNKAKLTKGEFSDMMDKHIN